MSEHADDTELDALAAQVRSVPRLSDEEISGLISAAHDGDQEARRNLVEQQLATVLDAAMASRDTDLDVGELYQEGSVAATVAVEEYVSREGRAAGLRGYVERVVSTHLDDVVARDKARHEEEEKLIADARLVESAELVLRRELGRSPTPVEVAARLQWPPEKVEAIDQILAAARELFDEEIALYLDEDDAGR